MEGLMMAGLGFLAAGTVSKIAAPKIHRTHVRKHPFYSHNKDYNSAMALFGGVTIASHVFLNTPAPLFAGYFALGAAMDTKKGSRSMSSGRIVSSAALVAAGASIIAKGAENLGGLGLESLERHLASKTLSTELLKMKDTVTKLRKNNPNVARLLSPKTFGLLVGAMSVPIIHNTIKRVMDKAHRRKAYLHPAGMSSTLDNDAGKSGKGNNHSPLVLGNKNLDLTFTGSLNTHYNHPRHFKL